MGIQLMENKQTAGLPNLQTAERKSQRLQQPRGPPCRGWHPGPDPPLQTAGWTSAWPRRCSGLAPTGCCGLCSLGRSSAGPSVGTRSIGLSLSWLAPPEVLKFNEKMITKWELHWDEKDDKTSEFRRLFFRKYLAKILILSNPLTPEVCKCV